MIRSWRACMLAAGMAGIAVIAAPAAAADFDAAAADALVRRLMSADDVPGAALALIKHGRIVLARGYGFRDLASHAPVTTATLFNIGSISKSFTALAIAELVDEHRLALDAPILRYLPALRLHDPRTARVPTLRQLLSHTSGYPADEAWPRQVPPTRTGIVGEFDAVPPGAEPGARFRYCSRCIVLAAAALEQVTGQSWEAYVRAQIFQPLGMRAATFGPRGLKAAPDRAQPYRHDPVLGMVPVPWSRLQYLEPLAPAGGIDADIADMAAYALFQLGDGTVAGRRLLSAAMLAELHRPEIAVGTDWTPAAEREDLHYALGWFTAERHGLRVILHNGANPGFRAAILLAPSIKGGVVVLSNGESDRFTDAVTRGLLEQVLE